MKSSEMLPIAEKLDEVGYWSLEVWGGATFDVALRYLLEDPWDRLSELRKRVKKTRLQMLLRGQNVVGYHNYPDDVLDAFVTKAAERGLDVFRVFDALNDVRNVSRAIEAVKKNQKHAQGTLCYAISPIHTLEYYLARAREQRDLGIDSICIKDMAGILSPVVAFDLIKGLVSEVKLPVHLHCHASSGMAVATYLRAIDAGVSVLDTAHAPLAFATSQPAVESIVAMLQGTPADPGLDLRVIEQVSEYFDKVKHDRGITYDRIVDEMVIVHQIPGGMASNLVSQLKEQRALDRLKEVLEEVPRVRKDMGYPPLVTPTSQMVGVQAAFNVLSGARYKVVPNEIRDYVRGLYGRSPAPITDEIRQKILGDEKPIEGRPADLLEPLMPKVRAELDKGLVTKEEDYISYALFPEVALKYFTWRKNPGPLGEEQMTNGGGRRTKDEGRRTEDMDQTTVKLVKEFLELAKKNDVAELEIEQAGSKIKIKRGSTCMPTARFMPSATGETFIQPRPSSSYRLQAPEPPPAASPAPSPQSPAPNPQLEEIKSPMVGTFYLRPRPDAPAFVEKNAIAEPGQTLGIIEAMKLMNEIEAEKKCKVVEILVADGDAVEYGQVLFRIEPA